MHVYVHIYIYIYIVGKNGIRWGGVGYRGGRVGYYSNAIPETNVNKQQQNSILTRLQADVLRRYLEYGTIRARLPRR